MKAMPADVISSKLDQSNYEMSKILILGLAAVLFRDDIVLKTMEPFRYANGD
jgi:hypothetical protein